MLEMTIKIQATELYKAVKAVKRTEFSPTLLILNHARIRLTDEGMKITTTDLEKSLTETVHFWGNGDRWETCVPMINKTKSGDYRHEKIHKFYPFLDWLKVAAEYKETLELEFVENIQLLKIKAGASRTEFKCIDAQEFPPCDDNQPDQPAVYLNRVSRLLP
jgi:DNA polymerase III sliding clamp (beta) subunit (PCNA family)